MEMKMIKGEAGQCRLRVENKKKSSTGGGFYDTEFSFYPLNKTLDDYWWSKSPFSLGLALPESRKNRWQNVQLGKVV